MSDVSLFLFSMYLSTYFYTYVFFLYYKIEITNNFFSFLSLSFSQICDVVDVVAVPSLFFFCWNHYGVSHLLTKHIYNIVCVLIKKFNECCIGYLYMCFVFLFFLFVSYLICTTRYKTS